jgi:hypothetical protein
LSAAVGDQWRIAYAERVREAMGADFRAVADVLRSTFGAKLAWLESESLTVGKPLEPSEPIGEKAYLRARHERETA